MQTPPNILHADFEGEPEGAGFDRWREEIGRGFQRFDFTPLCEGVVVTHTRMHVLPNLVVGWGATTPMCYGRSRDLVRDDDDAVALFVSRDTAFSIETGGRAHEAPPNGGALWDISTPGTLSVFEMGAFNALRLDRGQLNALFPRAEERLQAPILNSSPELTLLRGYLDLVCAPAAPPHGEEASRLIGVHILDLAALALGADGDFAAQARGRGGDAARLAQIKADIATLLWRTDLSPGVMAARHRVSKRYVQALFARAGTTFSDYVLERRLLMAFRMLMGAHGEARKVSDVAAAAGFGDVSYFHRAFRRRFGDTPAGVRRGERDS